MSKQPLGDFKVKIRNEDIEIVEPIEVIRTDISFGIQIQGCVPFYEADLVRIEAGYNLIEWDKLDYFMKAKEVAHFRLRRLISLHEGDARILHERVMTRSGI